MPAPIYGRRSAIRRHQRCCDHGHESIARAALVLRDRETFLAHVLKARDCAAGVTDAEEREPLEQDLQALESAFRSST